MYNALVKITLVRITLAMLILACCATAADVRVGIIGTDTSHSPAFTKLLNSADPSALPRPRRTPAHRVVAAWKGGSADLPEGASHPRWSSTREELRTKYGVGSCRISPRCWVKEWMRCCSAVWMGAFHLAQARAVLAAHKPVFIDKPLASTLEDAPRSCPPREVASLGNPVVQLVRACRVAARLERPSRKPARPA